MALPPVFKGRCHGGPMDGRIYSADQPHQVFTVPPTDVPVYDVNDPKEPVDVIMVSSGTYEWDYPGRCWRWHT